MKTETGSRTPIDAEGLKTAEAFGSGDAFDWQPSYRSGSFSGFLSVPSAPRSLSSTHRGQLSLFPDCFPIRRSLSEVPPPGPSIVRSLAEFLCPYRQSRADSAQQPQQVSPKCFCASYAILISQEFESQLEQPIAGEGEDTAGNWASVMEFLSWRKPDKHHLGILAAPSGAAHNTALLMSKAN